MRLVCYSNITFMTQPFNQGIIFIFQAQISFTYKHYKVIYICTMHNGITFNHNDRFGCKMLE